MADEKIFDGGLQYVPQIAIQYIYLDFDGELTSYNGEILTVEDVEVKDSALTEERIKNILAELNAKYADQKVVFVTQRPTAAEYSTIFVGKTSAFDQYGAFKGLAETIDEGNANKTDKAFVNLDSTATDPEIISTISHETDHLLGTLNHGGEGLQAYAAYYVPSGITSRGITLNYDSMYVSSGGTANATTVNGGGLYVYGGGTATATMVNYSGYLYVSSGGTANSTTVNSEGYLYVNSGGTANSTKVNYGGYLYVNSGGTANSTTVNYGGYLDVPSSGMVYPTTVNSRGELYVYSGGTANATTVNKYGELYVSSGGAALNIVENGGYVHVAAGANVTFTPNAISGLVLSNASATLHSGTTANATTVNSEGWLGVHGGTANVTMVNRGSMTVSSGGTANATTVNDYGELVVYYGGTANATTVNGDFSGGLLVYSGGTANATTVNNGYLYVYSGGTANATTVNDWGFLDVSSGGTANATTVKGELYVSSGGTANATTVNSRGEIRIEGGTANSTTVNAGGWLYVFSGGTANSTTVNSGGWLYVFSGGTANSTTVNSGGDLWVSSDGTHRGSLQIEAGAIVSADAGATIDFSVAERTAADEYLINDISLISGAPTYTITVVANQRAGTYKLAQGAGSFTGTLSVGDGSVAYGSVTVNGEDLVYNGVTYSLDQVGGSLTLTISGTSAPAAVENDLDGNGLADTILRHTLQGYCGAWLTEDSTIGWGNLSNIGNDVKLLGMGNVKDSSDSGLDIYMLNGDTVAAWVTEGGKVTGYQSLYKHKTNMNVLGLADFDGDGVTDYLLRSNTGDVGCIMGDGNRWNYFQSLGKEWNIAATGDFNGDGRDDLILKHNAGFAGTWLTQENGSVKWADLDTLSGGLEIIGSGDFNGDGTDDVLLRKGNWVGAWLVEEGSVDSFMGIKNNLTSTVEDIADFDGDGIDDLRVHEGSNIGVLYVKGADTTQWQYFKSVGSEWSTAFDAQVV